jgi:hypothetical protein
MLFGGTKKTQCQSLWRTKYHRDNKLLTVRYSISSHQQRSRYAAVPKSCVEKWSWQGRRKGGSSVHLKTSRSVTLCG